MPVPALVAIVWVGVYLFLKFAIKPPLPSSLIFMYMTMISIGLVVAISIREDILKGFKDPVVDFLRGDRYRALPWRVARWVLLVTLPIYIGNLVYQRVMPQFEPPVASRVIHPAPPPEAMGLVNPLHHQTDELAEYLEEGARIYFENCVFCHGDRLAGEGLFAHGFNPPPADFADPGTIAQLQESYVFWRVSSGGPGLPDESTPWDSAMPKWEDMLSEEDRWKVVMYLYDATGYTPRTWE
jgi:mono/diheme cytochrome c family protein